MADNVKRMDIKEFREFGYLQELNRLYLHPLGLALEVDIGDDGTERLGGVWDYREDPEGILYGGEYLAAMPEKAERVAVEMRRMAAIRKAELGYIIQPAE